MNADENFRTRVLIAHNTLWNMAGALLPIPVALVCIPVLVSSLGLEQFGVLGLAWMLMGYFGMFDFGLGQSTTRFVSADLARGERGMMRALTLGSVLLHGAMGLVGALIFALLVPWLTESVFTLPGELASETQVALYWLVASVPAIVITAAVRGVLEGLQRFDIVNLIRVPAAIVNYAGPVIALYFGTGLPLVVGVIVIARFAVLAAYALTCLQLLPPAQAGSRLESATLVQLAAYGGWLTVSNFVNPLIIAADRFIIASTISVAAVAFYVTPYEIITKAWILSASLLGALFPVFSALAAREPRSIRPACRSAELYLLSVATPAIALLLGCADLLLEWWLGQEFRDHSTTVAQFLALGILVNIVAQVPLTALNAVGRADVTAKIAALELPFYAIAIWYGAARYGINGVAAIWAARAVMDALALFFAAHAVLPTEARDHQPGRLHIGNTAILCMFLAGAWFTAHAYQDNIPLRSAMLVTLLIVLIVWEWRVLLTRDDQDNFKALWNQLLTNKAR